MKRGDLVTVALNGDQGKPRLALVVQADLFGDLSSVTILPITSTIVDAPLLPAFGAAARTRAEARYHASLEELKMAA